MLATWEIEKMSDEQFLHYALEILTRELGLYGYARFLRLYRPGKGDYTRDRHQWLDGLTRYEILANIKKSAA
jgi:hypothetical protein